MTTPKLVADQCRQAAVVRVVTGLGALQITSKGQVQRGEGQGLGTVESICQPKRAWQGGGGKARGQHALEDNFEILVRLAQHLSLSMKAEGVVLTFMYSSISTLNNQGFRLARWHQVVERQAVAVQIKGRFLPSGLQGIG